MNQLSPLVKPEFARKRTPEDINVITEVYQRLGAAGVSNLAQWLQEPELVEAADAPPELQRFLISRNLNAKFCAVGVETRIERMVLNAQSSFGEYLAHIEQYVAPGLAKLYPVDNPA